MALKRKAADALLPVIRSVGPWHTTTFKAKKVIDVVSPADGSAIAQLELASPADVRKAVASAQVAFEPWAALTIKRRAAIMHKFHALAEQHSTELVECIMKENGKNRVEAAGDLAKGLETVEWACSMPQLAQGKHLTVSSGVTCHEIKDPVGVVASIVPFNFPFMVRRPNPGPGRPGVTLLWRPPMRWLVAPCA